MRMIRQGLLVLLIAALTACGGGGGGHTPRGDVWSGFTIFPPSFIQYYIEGIVIHEIFVNGSPTGNIGIVVYLKDKSGGDGFGLYKIWDKNDVEGGGVVFLDSTQSMGFLFGSFPTVPGLGMLAIIMKTQKNVPLDFLYDDLMISWVGVTKETDGTTVTTTATTMSCGLSSSNTCNYTRLDLIGGTVTDLVYSNTNHAWTGYFSEPATGRSGDSILAMTPDKKGVVMVNCDTDHKSPIDYVTDCNFFIGLPA